LINKKALNSLLATILGTLKGLFYFKLSTFMVEALLIIMLFNLV